MDVIDDTGSGFEMNTTRGCLDNSAAVSRAQKAEAAAAVVYSTRCSSRRGKGAVRGVDKILLMIDCN